MTEKLFYKNQYLKEFEGDIVKIAEKEGKCAIVLDKTAFFPGGGGQWGDTGTLEGERIIDVYEEQGEIYHLLEENSKTGVSKFKVGDKVKGIIDWNRRLDGMQHHLGQHLLSGCFFTLFNANTTSIHIGKDICTVDIIGHLEENQIREAEEYANSIIKERVQVDMFVPSKQELKKLKLRRALPKSNEEIRIVKIGDLDINACCGVHPSNTLDLQLIKIKGYEKHKGNTRIEYLTGERAVKDTLKEEKLLKELCNILTAGQGDAISTLLSLKDNLKLAREENKKIKMTLGNYQLKELLQEGEKIGDITVVSKIFTEENMKYLNKLATDLSQEDNRIILFALKDRDKCNLLFAASKNIKEVKMNDLLKNAITLVDGKGGGTPLLAQGGGKNPINLEGAIEYAIRKLKEVLI